MADVNLDLSKATPWGAAESVVNTIIERFWPDPQQAAQAKLAFAQMQQTGQLAQIAALSSVDQAQAATNTAEANQRSFWVNGARPAILWICALALFTSIIGAPGLGWIMHNLCNWTAPPPLDMAEVFTLLFGMLGLSTQRTIERINGVIPPGK